MREIVLFGRRLRSLRKVRQFTQEALGEKAKLSYKYIGACERAEENPSLKVISKLAKALGIELRDLFEFEHEETDPGKLRKKMNRLLRDADDEVLQQALKLLRALIT